MTLTRQIAAYLLSFVASSLSSAGGVGGGSLYVPIINLVANLDLKSASAFSAFMVTGGSLSTVIYNLRFSKSSIDYEIATLSQPFMLLGVGIGVVCNVAFPEWLVTVLFAGFIGFCTWKTFGAGFKCWKCESNEAAVMRLDDFDDGLKEGLLLEKFEGGEEEILGIPWKKFVILVMVWMSFFGVHLLLVDNGAKNMIHIRPCGVGYWLITSIQIPLAVGFTALILYMNRKPQHVKLDEEKNNKEIVVQTSCDALPIVVFPLAALLSGILGGLFGIGGGMLINPVLLQIGIPPQVTAATTSFMVMFSSSMSMVQYLILGMEGVGQAFTFAVVCFVASIFGLILVQRAIAKSGRASLIVFSVGIVMALSTVSITCFGAFDVWKDYRSGENMWFKPFC